MKVKEIIRQIDDPKIYIEIKQTLKNGGASFGIYTKKDLFYRDNLTKLTIKNINIQYFDGKRLLVLETNI